MMKLFYTPGTCALASHIALEEAGADFELARIEFKTDDQKQPEFLAVNPKGRVPALVTDKGILTETPAILAYIAQKFPDGGLGSLDDAFEFARMQSINSYLCSTLHINHAHRMRGNRWVDADNADAIKAMQAKVPQSVGECFDLIENDILQGPWGMGENYTICDPYLFTVARWLEGDGVDPARIPNVMAHRERMGERAAVKRALAAQE
jgi:glutathione S-transferase